MHCSVINFNFVFLIHHFVFLYFYAMQYSADVTSLFVFCAFLPSPLVLQLFSFEQKETNSFISGPEKEFLE